MMGAVISGRGCGCRVSLWDWRACASGWNCRRARSSGMDGLLTTHKTRIQWFGFGCVCALCVCKFGCVRSPKRDNVVLTSVRVLAGWYQRSEIPRMGDARSKNAGGDRRCESEGGMTDCPIDYYVVAFRFQTHQKIRLRIERVCRRNRISAGAYSET